MTLAMAAPTWLTWQARRRIQDDVRAAAGSRRKDHDGSQCCCTLGLLYGESVLPSQSTL